MQYEITVEAPNKRKNLYSAQDVSATGIQKLIAQDRVLVVKVEANAT
jgi:hypothetical protein